VSRDKTLARDLIAALLAATMVFGAVRAVNAAENGLPNLEMPTRGGRLVWKDHYVHAGWRIQENTLTGHHRLLDPDNVRMAWGSYTECKAEFDRLRRRLSIHPASRHLVVFIHGILGSAREFIKQREAARAAGFDAVALSYPSTRRRIQDHAHGIAVVIERLEGTDTISFVTYSMGGIVLRNLMARNDPWRRTLKLGRAVMIAPPNQGAAAARMVKSNGLYRYVFGETGQQLVPAEVFDMPGLAAVPFAVIAGGKGDGEGFNPVLPGDDDGAVRVAETRLAGSRAHLIVPALHQRITDNPETVRATVNFLRHGRFGSLN